MAVVVQCFHCNAILELDDGFRGGVCRCGTCGSHLQVPKGDPAGIPPRAPRPAGPPAPSKRSASATPAPSAPAATADPAAPGSGGLDPTRTADTGGMSSGLGRVHQTRPISHVTGRKSTSAAPKSTSGVPESTSAAAKSNSGVPNSNSAHTPAWLATLLLLAIAAVVAAMIYVYIFKE